MKRYGPLGLAIRMGIGLAALATAGAPVAPPVGRQLKPANMAQAYQWYTDGTVVPGDSIDMHGAWFTPGAPYQWIFTKSFAAPGVAINCHPSQVMAFKGTGVANGRTRTVGANLGVDLVFNNYTSATNHHIDLNNCSLFSFFGCFTSASGFFGLYTQGCSDITFRNNIITSVRHDGLRTDGGPVRFDVRGNTIADNCPQQRVYYKADGTAPLFTSADPGAPWKVFEPDHGDGWQAYTGAMIDILGQYNYFKMNIGQGIWWADVTSVLRAQIMNNTIFTAYPQAVFMPTTTDCELTSNAISKHPDYDPDSANQLISVQLASGGFRTGLNTFTLGTTTVSAPGGAAALQAAISGTLVPANPPTWSTDGATVGTINSKIGGQVFVPYAGPNKLLNPPSLQYDGPTPPPWATGIYIKAIPGNAQTPASSFIGYWNSVWTRWYKDGVQQAAASGPAGMVSPVTTDGSWTADQSADSTNGINGTWTAQSAAVVVGTLPVSGWDTTGTGAGAYAFSGANDRTATRSGVDGSPRNLRGVKGYAQTADFCAYFEADLTDNAFGNTDARIGVGNSSASLTNYEGGANVAILNMSGDLAGNSTSLGNGGTLGDGVRVGFCLKYTLSTDTLLLFVKKSGSWILGGDPDGAGAGINLNYLNGLIYPFVQTTEASPTPDVANLYTAGGDFTLTKPTIAAAWGG